MLCCAMLCDAVLCCAVRCYAMRCDAMLCRARYFPKGMGREGDTLPSCIPNITWRPPEHLPAIGDTLPPLPGALPRVILYAT
jgi:hypothetical protein